MPYLAVVLLFTVFQRRLIFQPVRAESLKRDDAGFLPHSGENLILAADGDLSLNGWLLRTSRPLSNPDRWLVLYFPGNSGHRGLRRTDLFEVADAGFDVMALDYRGYGDNAGSPSEQRIAEDASKIWTLAMERGYSPGRTLVFGESLGGAFAVRLCAELSREGTPPAGLLVESSFDSLGSLAGTLYPLFPFRFLLFDRLDSASRISEVTCPLTIIHGQRDDIVPIEHGRRLFEAAGPCAANGVPKRWKPVREMGHNDMPNHVMTDTLLEFTGRGIP